jgi:hypothetical protein
MIKLLICGLDMRINLHVHISKLPENKHENILIRIVNDRVRVIFISFYLPMRTENSIENEKSNG